MSGRQDEESDKASMCKWGIRWESRRLVSSGHTKMCSTERGISAAVRTLSLIHISEPTRPY